MATRVVPITISPRPPQRSTSVPTSASAERFNCSKAERELGWQPRVAFDQGLAETIAWYQSNPGWVAGIKNKDYMSYYERQYGKR